jgi:hypothetical protein
MYQNMVPCILAFTLRLACDDDADMNLPRYKILVQSVIGESKDQGFQFASKSLWDPETDDYSFGSFLNEHVFAAVGAWALYLT